MKALINRLREGTTSVVPQSRPKSAASAAEVLPSCRPSRRNVLRVAFCRQRVEESAFFLPVKRPVVAQRVFRNFRSAAGVGRLAPHSRRGGSSHPRSRDKKSDARAAPERHQERHRKTLRSRHATQSRSRKNRRHHNTLARHGPSRRRSRKAGPPNQRERQRLIRRRTPTLVSHPNQR